MRVNSTQVHETNWLQLLFRSFEVWLVIAAAESIQGVVRTAVLVPVVGDFRARQIAVFSGSAIIVGIAIILRRWLAARTFGSQLAAGAFWVGATLAFEVAVGRLAIGASWDRIRSDYDLSDGGLMPIGLVIMLFAPAIAARLRSGHRKYDKKADSC